jgi:hypothetical protein
MEMISHHLTRIAPPTTHYTRVKLNVAQEKLTGSIKKKKRFLAGISTQDANVGKSHCSV